MVDNKNKGGEFDDDTFDAEDFSDTDFGTGSFEDDTVFDDLPEDDGQLEGDDFEADEWADDQEEAAATDKKGKKPKKEKADRGDRSGMSFNTMMIIGGVVLGGGVMALNIMNKTTEAKLGQKSMFQSILGIGGIMDGTLFGEKEAEPTAEETALEQKAQDEAFLNNPDIQIPETPAGAEGNPPLPTPIAPSDNSVADTGEPLTPMPAPSPEAPRGPEDSFPPAPVEQADLPAPPITPESAPVVAETPVPPSPEVVASEQAPVEPAPSAEDILKKAMANREQKVEDQKSEAVADETATAQPIAEMAQAVEEKVSEAKEAIKDAVTPDATAPVVLPETPVVDAVPPVPSVPVASKEDLEQNKQAVASLESKIDTLLKRMDQIESNLDSVKDAKDENYQQMAETVQSLKKDITLIKERPVPAAPVRETTRPVTENTDEEAPTPKPAPIKAKKVKKAAPVSVEEQEAEAPAVSALPVKTAAAKALTSSGRWELRAAQPGRAWVSKPGERDMQGVAVGQSLDGLGRITAIIYLNGRWSVIGTQGQIQQ